MSEKDSNVPNFMSAPVGSYCNRSFLLRITVGSTRIIKSICVDTEILSLKFNIIFHLTLIWTLTLKVFLLEANLPVSHPH